MRRICQRGVFWRLLFLEMLFFPLPWAMAATEQPYIPVVPSKDQAQVQRQQTQPLNNTPMWREVRSGEEHQTQVRGVETGVLVQTQGELWREIRNGPVSLYGGILLVVVFAGITLFHWIHGPIKLHSPPTGRTVPRFSDWDRVIHWSTAISFVILALSGLVLLFGKHVLLPMLGYTLFSWLAILGKNLHNFVGPLFVFCAAAMFVTFVRDNLWKAYDFRWFKNLGGMLGGEHIPSGMFNAGEKVWFWLGLFLLTIVMGATGLILDFPNFEQGRGTMQQANVIHAIAAILYMTLALGHIYMGTIGVEGAYDSMRIRGGTGSVDEVWAKEHHEYWYDDVKAGRTGEKPAAAAGAAQPQRP